MTPKKRPPMKTSVAIDPDLLDWVDQMVLKKRFANRTHAIEFALQILRESGYGTEKVTSAEGLNAKPA
jgi:Arc/MetJ-type ribon-helix-helix transcriptional regulator